MEMELELDPVRITVDPRSQAARRPFEHPLIARATAFAAGPLDPGLAIQTLYPALAAVQSCVSSVVNSRHHLRRETFDLVAPFWPARHHEL